MDPAVCHAGGDRRPSRMSVRTAGTTYRPGQAACPVGIVACSWLDLPRRPLAEAFTGGLSRMRMSCIPPRSPHAPDVLGRAERLLAQGDPGLLPVPLDPGRQDAWCWWGWYCWGHRRWAATWAPALGTLLWPVFCGILILLEVSSRSRRLVGTLATRGGVVLVACSWLLRFVTVPEALRGMHLVLAGGLVTYALLPVPGRLLGDSALWVAALGFDVAVLHARVLESEAGTYAVFCWLWWTNGTGQAVWRAVRAHVAVTRGSAVRADSCRAAELFLQRLHRDRPPVGGGTCAIFDGMSEPPVGHCRESATREVRGAAPCRPPVAASLASDMGDLVRVGGREAVLRAGDDKRGDGPGGTGGDGYCAAEGDMDLAGDVAACAEDPVDEAALLDSVHRICRTCPEPCALAPSNSTRLVSGAAVLSGLCVLAWNVRAGAGDMGVGALEAAVGSTSPHVVLLQEWNADTLPSTWRVGDLAYSCPEGIVQSALDTGRSSRHPWVFLRSDVARLVYSTGFRSVSHEGGFARVSLMTSDSSLCHVYSVHAPVHSGRADGPWQRWWEELSGDIGGSSAGADSVLLFGDHNFSWCARGGYNYGRDDNWLEVDAARRADYVMEGFTSVESPVLTRRMDGHPERASAYDYPVWRGGSIHTFEAWGGWDAGSDHRITRAQFDVDLPSSRADAFVQR
eukprot:gene11962-15449_t